jgi:hypothetical protein
MTVDWCESSRAAESIPDAGGIIKVLLNLGSLVDWTLSHSRCELGLGSLRDLEKEDMWRSGDDDHHACGRS